MTSDEPKVTAKMFLQMMSGLPYHGWRRLLHSILIPVAVIFVLSWIAQEVLS